VSSGILLPFDGVFPRLAEGVYLAPGAVVIGDVEIGSESSVWFNAVIRGDVAPIRIGSRSNVQDGAVLHVDRGTPCVVGDEVTIGHAAVVHGTTVRDGVTIGMGATVLRARRSRRRPSSLPRRWCRRKPSCGRAPS
jgi:carbonic anhydrase/acetyltransferase-like protein (isoleucine patch superfamily)